MRRGLVCAAARLSPMQRCHLESGERAEQLEQMHFAVAPSVCAKQTCERAFAKEGALSRFALKVTSNHS